MNPKSSPNFNSLPPSVRLALAIVVSSSTSLALDWDTEVSAGIQPASGDWNTIDTNWSADGTTLVGWVSVAPDNDAALFRDTAVFGGMDGSYVINLTESLISGALVFNNSGYSLEGSGNTLDLGNSDSNVTLGAGTINSIGGGLKLRSYSGRLGAAESVTSGTLNVDSGAIYEARGGANLSLDGIGTTLNVSGLLDTVTGRLNLGNDKVAPGASLITDVTIVVKGGGIIDCNGNATQIGLSGNYGTETSKRDAVKGTLIVESGGTADLAEVRIGQFGTGFFEIQSGGTVTAGNVVMGNGGAALAQLDLEGDLTANFIRMNKPDNIVNFNGGVLTAASSAPEGLIWGPEGTLNIRDGGITINTNGFDVVVNRGLNHSSIITDNATDGGLIKDGLGKLTLAEDNTYNGFTDILEGTLEIGNGGTKGTVTGVILNDGHLIYNRSDDVVITISSEGAGSLSHVGAGRLTLAAEGLYTGDTTVTTGILELDNGFALDDGSRLTIEGTGTVELTQDETVNELFIGLAPKTPGTYGAIGNGTTDFEDAVFTGSGVLTVLSAGTAEGQNWDTSTDPDIQPDSGDWNTTATNWSADGTTLVQWNPALPSTFGGVDTTATVTVTEDITTATIEFEKSGFTIIGDATADPLPTLTLGGGQINLADSTINSIGSDLTITRNAIIRLGQAPNVASGTLGILPGGVIQNTGNDLNIEGVNTEIAVGGILQIAEGGGRINLGTNQESGTDVSLTIQNGGQVLIETSGTPEAPPASSANIMQVGFADGGISDPGNVKGTINVEFGGLMRIGTDGERTMRLGQFGTGVLNIESGGLVQLGALALGNGGNASGTLNLSGTLEVDSLNFNKTASRANFDGGVLKATGVAIPELIKGGAGATNVRNGGLTVDTNGFDKSITEPLVHSTIVDDAAIDGGLTKIGEGKLTLDQVNTYTGATKVSGGTLNLDNGDAIPDTNSLVINTGGTVELTQNETVDTLFYGSSPQPAGTYGAPGNGTTDFEDARFTGTAVLTVLSEGSSASPFDTWALASGLDGTAGKENGPTDDPDNDGADNFTEFAFNGDPLSSSNNGQIAPLIQDASAPVGDELTLIVAVRDGATFASAGASPSLIQTANVDGVAYTIEGTLDLAFPGSDVAFASGPSDTAPVEANLPDLTGTDWEYHTFKLVASENLAAAKGFMRASATAAP